MNECNECGGEVSEIQGQRREPDPFDTIDMNVITGMSAQALQARNDAFLARLKEGAKESGAAMLARAKETGAELRASLDWRGVPEQSSDGMWWVPGLLGGGFGCFSSKEAAQSAWEKHQAKGCQSCGTRGLYVDSRGLCTQCAEERE